MSAINRISAIQARMQEIQSKFGPSPVQSSLPVYQVGSSNQIQGLNNTQGVSFEQLLATKMNEPSSAGTAGNVKNLSLSSNAGDYEGMINEASQKYGVDPKFVKAIIQQESGFNPNATSWVGAMGMMQLMPETAAELGVKNAYDPRENIMGGVKYIKQQLDTFGGDKRKALAAYNAGAGNVMKYGGIPPFEETQNYVANIMSMYQAQGGVE